MKTIILSLLLLSMVSCQDHYTKAFCNSSNLIKMNVKDSVSIYLNDEYYEDLQVSFNGSKYLTTVGNNHVDFQFCRVGKKIFAEFELVKYQKFILTQVTNNIFTGPYELTLLGFDREKLDKDSVNYYHNRYMRYVRLDNSGYTRKELLNYMAPVDFFISSF